MNTPIPEDMRAAIAEDYAAGLTGPAVAEKYGIGTASVYRIAGGISALRGRKFPQHVLDEAVQDYLDSGDPVRTVAARHPLSQDTLRQELRERDVTRPGGGAATEAVRSATIDDFLSGMTIAAVSEKHGVSRSAIAAWLNRAGIGVGDRHDSESPFNYTGGWVVVGGVRRPLAPVRGVA